MKDNYTPIHNEVLEALCKINLSPYEVRVLFCIWRKTYGFIDKKTGQRKKNDWISGSQIADMTKLDRRHVSRALKGLRDKFVISRDDKKTGFSKDFIKLMSSVEMTNSKKGFVISRGGTPPPVEMTTSPSRDDNLSSVEGDTKEKKENIQKKLLQKKSIYDISEEYFIEITERYKVPLSLVKLAKEEMDNWLEAKGKSYKGFNGYKAGLRNWVLRKAIGYVNKAQGDPTKRGVDARNL